MKTILDPQAARLLRRALFTLSFLPSIFCLSAWSQGTAFTYQGRLNDGGAPANGIYDLRITIYDSSSGGVQQGNAVTNSGTGVTNGLFTVTSDLGNQFTGADRWLEIAVRTNGASNFFTLNPRQALTPAPYAITAAGLQALRVEVMSNGAPNLIGGCIYNSVSNGVYGATIGGGGAVSFLDYYAFSNIVTGNFGVVAGGSQNTAGAISVVGGGYGNSATGTWSTVAGGAGNTASGDSSTVSGGQQNTCSGQYAWIGGGQLNVASGLAAMIPSGISCQATGYTSFAAGYLARAYHDGAFVWADSQNAVLASTAANQFSVRAGGGVRLFGDIQVGTGGTDYHNILLGGGNASGFLYGSYPHWGDGIHLGYNYYADAAGLSHFANPSGGTSRISVGYNSIVLATGDIGVQPTFHNVDINGVITTVNGIFNNFSDRDGKEDFEQIRPEEMLAKVSRLPISKWSLKADAASTRHVGPVAQDFYSIFGIGTDDRHIAPMDESGVALAAIQGLNEKVEARRERDEVRMRKLEEENAALKQRLATLEKKFSMLAENR